ncbi:hypothetical protein EsH8_VII_000909 [Colletotrichum jinshuiense]
MMFAAQSVLVALLAATAMAAPVAQQQQPLATPNLQQKFPAVVGVPMPVPSRAPSTLPPAAAPGPSVFSSAWSSIFGDKDGKKEDLGRSCFCANGSICCNTPKGLDCAQGLCGI